MLIVATATLNMYAKMRTLIKCKAAYPDESPSAICNFGPVLISLASHYHDIALLCCSDGPPDGSVPVLAYIPPPSTPNITFNIVTQQQGSQTQLCDSLMVGNDEHKMQAQQTFT